MVKKRGKKTSSRKSSAGKKKTKKAGGKKKTSGSHKAHRTTARKTVKRKAHRRTTARKSPSQTASSSRKHHVARVPSSVPGFDRLIEDGFEKNSTNLIVGGSGSGKTIFSTQFLVGGMKKGETCLFITFEEKKKQFYENMKEFGWDLAAYEKKGLFTFLEYAPIRVKTMLEEGGGAIESVILKKKVSRIVIDSITSFALLFDKELEKREAALSLFNMIRKWDCTSLLTFEGEPGEKSAESRAIEFESDSIVTIFNVRSGNERARYLEVLKMRGTEHSKKVYPCEIGPNGVVVGLKPVSKLPPAMRV